MYIIKIRILFKQISNVLSLFIAVQLMASVVYTPSVISNTVESGEHRFSCRALATEILQI